MQKLIFLLIMMFSVSVYAESMSKSCSGTMRYCDPYGICTDEYYYLYAYQYVKFSNNQLKRHRHRFNFRGYVLGEEDNYTYSGQYTDSHLIYTGPNFDLAIPWDRSVPIFMIDHNTGVWDELCP